MTLAIVVGSQLTTVTLGAAIALIGLFVIGRMLRHDLVDAAVASTYQVARGKRTTENPTPFDEKLQEIDAGSTTAGKAVIATALLVKHLAAQAAYVVGTVMLVIGVLVVAAGMNWW